MSLALDIQRFKVRSEKAGVYRYSLLCTVALLTLKIRSVWDHLMKCKKDLTSRRALRRLVHQRAKMLKYIKGIDRDRYDRILERLALEPDSVEGELVV